MTPATGDKVDKVSRRNRIMRVEITATSVVIVLLAIGLAVLAAEVLVSARRVLSWALACAVVATLIELVVQWLDRWMKRAFAVVLVLLVVGVSTAGLVFGVFRDLDREVHDIQSDAPAAARHLERSERFGKTAREIHLQERVEAAVERLSNPSSGLAGEAVSSLGTYIVCIVLTILFLSWGPRLTKGALDQLGPTRADLARRVTLRAFARSRHYVFLALIQAVVVGFITWGACTLADTPAPIPLALGLAALSLVPGLGILVGSLPILLLTFGLSSNEAGVKLTILFVAMQAISTFVIQPKIVRHSHLYVGPAIMSIAGLIGFELYGIGGALYGTAIIILGVALIDSIAESRSEISKELDSATTL